MKLTFLLAALVTVGIAQNIVPDPSVTPGLSNQEVTQQNIKQTICKAGWTKTIRPSASYTNKLKIKQMDSAGIKGNPADFEEDHFISLEIGGNPTDPRNLWPEPYEPRPGAREKDQVEDYLHRQVCSGKMTLKAAQAAIVAGWPKLYSQIHAAKKK